MGRNGMQSYGSVNQLIVKLSSLPQVQGCGAPVMLLSTECVCGWRVYELIREKKRERERERERNLIIGRYIYIYIYCELPVNKEKEMLQNIEKTFENYIMYEQYVVVQIKLCFMLCCAVPVRCLYCTLHVYLHCIKILYSYRIIF